MIPFQVLRYSFINFANYRLYSIAWNNIFSLLLKESLLINGILTRFFCNVEHLSHFRLVCEADHSQHEQNHDVRCYYLYDSGISYNI